MPLYGKLHEHHGSTSITLTHVELFKHSLLMYVVDKQADVSTFSTENETMKRMQVITVNVNPILFICE